MHSVHSAQQCMGSGHALSAQCMPESVQDSAFAQCAVHCVWCGHGGLCKLGGVCVADGKRYVPIVAVAVVVAAVHGESGSGPRARLCLDAVVCAGDRRLALGVDASRRRESLVSGQSQHSTYAL